MLLLIIAVGSFNNIRRELLNGILLFYIPIMINIPGGIYEKGQT